METAPPTSASSSSERERVGRLKLRRDFLSVASGGRFHTKALSLQARRRAAEASASSARVGYTVTRKVGTATERNRIRRRMREAIRTSPDLSFRDDHDYVLVGRREALSVPFDQLVADLEAALTHVHKRDGKRRHRLPVEARPSNRVESNRS